jgi:hypothetical protein
MTNDDKGKEFTTPTLPNSLLANPSLTIAGTANQVTVSGGGPVALGGTATISLPSPLTTPGNVAITGQGVATLSGIGVTPTVGIAATNSSLAAAGAQQISPSLRLAGNGWKTTATAASQPVYFDFMTLPVQGTANPTGMLEISNTINGGTPTFVAQMDQSGNTVLGGTLTSTALTGTGLNAIGVVTNDAAGLIHTTPTLPVSLMAADGIVYAGASGPITVPVSGTYFFNPNSGFTNFVADTTGITTIMMPFRRQPGSGGKCCHRQN